MLVEVVVVFSVVFVDVGAETVELLLPLFTFAFTDSLVFLFSLLILTLAVLLLLVLTLATFVTAVLVYEVGVVVVQPIMARLSTNNTKIERNLCSHWLNIFFVMVG